MALFQHNQLTYRDLLSFDVQADLKSLPSDDIEILYQDFFIDFTKTSDAYQRLCVELGLQPNLTLLDALIERNKKNLLTQQES